MHNYIIINSKPIKTQPQLATPYILQSIYIVMIEEAREDCYIYCKKERGEFVLTEG